MASVFSPRKRFPGEIRVRSCNRCINMREPRTRVEASTRRHENAMKPSPMTVERGGGEWWRRTKVRARGEGSLMGRKGGWQNFLKRSPSCHGLRLREFFRAWKISIALWKIKTSALLVSLPNLDLWKFWKNSLLNIYKSEARIFSLKRNFFFFYEDFSLYSLCFPFANHRFPRQLPRYKI